MMEEKHDITALAQRMNEVDPRDEFEKLFPLPVFCIRFGTGYASTSFNDWAANTHKDRWEGWKAAMALMESRTVTVKLPEEFSDDEALLQEIEFCDDVSTDIQTAQWLKELRRRRAAGIQVIEGDNRDGN